MYNGHPAQTTMHGIFLFCLQAVVAVFHCNFVWIEMHPIEISLRLYVTYGFHGKPSCWFGILDVGGFGWRRLAGFARGCGGTEAENWKYRREMVRYYSERKLNLKHINEQYTKTGQTRSGEYQGERVRKGSKAQAAWELRVERQHLIKSIPFECFCWLKIQTEWLNVVQSMCVCVYNIYALQPNNLTVHLIFRTQIIFCVYV